MKLVKQVRDITGAPMSDCKAAISNSLNEADVISAACTWLRKVGKAQQAKRTGRAASQGLIGLHVDSDSKQAVLVELNTETDFVAQNEKFQVLLGDMVLAAAQQPTIEAVLQTQGQIQSIKIADQLADAVNSLRENIQLSRIKVLKAESFIGSYMHQAVEPKGVPPGVRIGRIGCVVAVRALPGAESSRVQNFAHTVAMHCAAALPRYLNAASVPPDILEAERKLLHEQVILSGKNVDRVDSIVTGRLKKFYEETCLNMQTLLVTENQESVSKAAAEAKCELTGFLRFEVGKTDA
jgi:elongation factor Ts